MSVYLKTDKENVDWREVADLLKESGLSDYDAEIQKTIFERSYAVAFVCDDGRIVGCGRALSDGVCQAAIYNVAVRPAYQGRQLGRAVIEALLKQVEGCTVILYTHPQTLALYEKFGFRRQKTGFVKLGVPEEHQKWMENEGFLLPNGYRFNDNVYERVPKGAT